MTTPMPDAAPDLAPVTIRPWQPGDDDAALACHNAVFGDGPRGTNTRSLLHWQWKFAANPTGRVMQMLAVHPAQGVVGIYAGLPVHVSLGGNRALAAQAVDHCVRPEWLRHGGEHGLFPRIGQAFLDRWLGTGPEQAQFVFGLPVAGWRSGARNLGWQIARDWDLTFRELPTGTSRRATPGELVVRAVPRFGPDADELFRRVEPELGAATVRDSRYLNWRYADHPDRRYVLFECRECASERLRGLCVYGTGDVLRANTSYVVDWLQAAHDGPTMTAMLAAAEGQAGEDGTGLLCSVWNHMDPRFLAMQEHGYRVRGTPWFLAIASAVYDTVFFREHWYFTLGDSDFV